MTKQDYIHNYRLPWTPRDLLLKEELLRKQEGPEKRNQEIHKPKGIISKSE